MGKRSWSAARAAALALSVMFMLSACSVKTGGEDTFLGIAGVRDALYRAPDAEVACAQAGGQDAVYIGAGDLANALSEYAAGWSILPDADVASLTEELAFALPIAPGGKLVFYAGPPYRAALTVGGETRVYAVSGDAYAAVKRLFDAPAEAVVHPAYRAAIARTDGSFAAGAFPHERAVIIQSVEELNQYYLANQYMHALSYANSDRWRGFADLANACDDAFFEKNLLVLALVETQAEDDPVSVEDVYVAAGELHILVHGTLPAVMVAGEPARFHAFIEVARADFDGTEAVVSYRPSPSDAADHSADMRHEIRVESGSFTVTPLVNPLWEATYDAATGQWFAADGEELEVADVAADVPLIKYSPDIHCVVSPDVAYVTYILYDAEYQMIGEFDTLNAAEILSLTGGAGTYYVRMRYESFGQAPAGEEQEENLGSEAFIRLKLDEDYLKGSIFALLRDAGVRVDKADSVLLSSGGKEAEGLLSKAKGALCAYDAEAEDGSGAPLGAASRVIRLMRTKTAVCELRAVEGGILAVSGKKQYLLRCGAWVFDGVWECASAEKTGVADNEPALDE